MILKLLFTVAVLLVAAFVWFVSHSANLMAGITLIFVLQITLLIAGIAVARDVWADEDTPPSRERET